MMANRTCSLAFTPLIVTYTLEIMPYAIRAKGLNVFSVVISLALIFNQYVNPIALDALGWKYYVRLLYHRWQTTLADDKACIGSWYTCAGSRSSSASCGSS